MALCRHRRQWEAFRGLPSGVRSSSPLRARVRREELLRSPARRARRSDRQKRSASESPPTMPQRRIPRAKNRGQRKPYCDDAAYFVVRQPVPRSSSRPKSAILQHRPLFQAVLPLREVPPFPDGMQYQLPLLSSRGSDLPSGNARKILALNPSRNPRLVLARSATLGHSPQSPKRLRSRRTSYRFATLAANLPR